MEASVSAGVAADATDRILSSRNFDYLPVPNVPEIGDYGPRRNVTDHVSEPP